MSHHRGVARDEYGNSISGASVTVYNAGTTTASTIYSEGTLTTAESNPFTTGDDGVYEFWADPGLYDIQISKAGYSTVTLSDTVVGHVFAKMLDGGSQSDTVATSYVLLDTTFAGAWTATLSPAYASPGFSLDATDHLVYNGTDTAVIMFTVTLTFSTDASDIYYFKLESDSGPTTIFEYQHFVDTTSKPYTVTLHGIRECASGEEFTFSIKKDATTSTFTVSQFELTARVL